MEKKDNKERIEMLERQVDALRIGLISLANAAGLTTAQIDRLKESIKGDDDDG